MSSHVIYVARFAPILPCVFKPRFKCPLFLVIDLFLPVGRAVILYVLVTARCATRYSDSAEQTVSANRQTGLALYCQIFCE